MSIQQSSRPVGVNLQPEEREHIKALYLSGIPTNVIARQLGLSRSTVSRLTLREGLREPVAKAGRRLTTEEIESIQLLYKTTILPKQSIADKMGISYDSVCHHTKGLTRCIPRARQEAIVALYLAGGLTADEIKASDGIPKKMLYAMVREAQADAQAY